MSTKKQSSQKDKSNLFFKNGIFIHHAFCVEGFAEPEKMVDEFKNELKHTGVALQLTAPHIISVDIFTIDMAREVADLARKRYTKESHKLIFIQALTLTREAQNALLKVLEEPKEEVTIFVCVLDASSLLETILSRVVTVPLSMNQSEKNSLQLAKKICTTKPIERARLIDDFIAQYEKNTFSRSDAVVILSLIIKNVHENNTSASRDALLKELSKIRVLMSSPGTSLKQALQGVLVALNLLE